MFVRNDGGGGREEGREREGKRGREGRESQMESPSFFTSSASPSSQ